ncbi:MAG: LA2681 family HEPN domain-containing protein [bacterium]|nr:LA2681 family HEPN domain-containing protein [bacterium]
MNREKFFKWFVDMRNKVGELVSAQKYDMALSHIENILQGIKDRSEEEQAYILAEFGGFLIDIAEESRDEKPGIKGLGILKRNEELIRKYVWDGSYFYNLGNAYDSIIKIKLANRRVEYKPKNFWLINQAKDSFWKAYKARDTHPEKKFQPNNLVNLGNSLSRSGRVVEAIQFYDLVIKDYPDFPKAHANRAEALFWLHQISGVSSFMLMYQIIQAYTKAAKGENIPLWMKKEFNRRATLFDRLMKDRPDYKNFDIKKEEKETEKDYQAHSEYRKFCLDHLLSLSEHALYCKCIGSRRDDLMIPTPSFHIQGQFVPVMEHYLNRIKSEFATSRLLYYRAVSEEKGDWEIFQDEVVYTELFEGESVDIKTEMLRTSYRLCFGILDKIGEGICELYDLADKNENIYFENFWKPRGKGLSKKQSERWERINSIENTSLKALYSQACDLTNRKGEWTFFKQWRNALEHGIFVVTDDKYPDLDPLKVLDKSRKVVTTNYSNFEQQTLHLLRFTRSAIFNFVFMVRTEGDLTEDSPTGLPLTLRYKEASY